MKHLLIAIAFVFTAAWTASPAQAQDTQIGLGVGLGEGLSIYVPIDFGTFRIEPQLGLSMTSSESGSVEQSRTTLVLGTGIFKEGATISNTVLYYGGRIGIAQESRSVETPAGDTDDSSTDLFLGPAVGAEYYFSERFSLGGEAQLMFTSFGEEGDDDVSSSQFQTQGVFFVRWYF